MEVGVPTKQYNISHVLSSFVKAKSRKLFKGGFGNNGHALEVLKGYQLLGNPKYLTLSLCAFWKINSQHKSFQNFQFSTI
jgi:hypothetical protein